VSLCGEIGGDVNFTGLLLALGLKEFSMHPSQILHVRDRLATLNHERLRKHAPLLIRARTHEEAEILLAGITGCEH
jgi:phosphoenolpyruvate-protein phosphotransferase (PTS system enzyme I)